MARRVSTTPLTSRLDESLFHAPRKSYPSRLLDRIQKTPEPEHIEWLLTDGRVGGYVFDKHDNTVWLYTLDYKDAHYSDNDKIPRVEFRAVDWGTFGLKAWDPLCSNGNVAGFKASFPGASGFRSYLIAGERAPYIEDECIFICVSDHSAYANSHKDTVPEIDVMSRHVVFKRSDIPVLSQVFMMINRLFMWNEHFLDYQRVKSDFYSPRAEGSSINAFTGRSSVVRRIKQRNRFRPYNSFGIPSWVCDGGGNSGDLQTDDSQAKAYTGDLQTDDSQASVYNKSQQSNPFSGYMNIASNISGPRPVLRQVNFAKVIKQSEAEPVVEQMIISCADSDAKSSESHNGLLACDGDYLSKKNDESNGVSGEVGNEQVADEVNSLVQMMEGCNLDDDDDDGEIDQLVCLMQKCRLTDNDEKSEENRGVFQKEA